MTRPWIPHAVEFVSDLDRPELAVSPWAGHRWFAFDLVRWARPGRIVELGTHYGCSYFAFCQAVMSGQGECEVVAVDTWEGEEHSGLYTEEVYETFTSILERRFSTVRTRVLRSTFDEALERVEDASVDILHIDGFHTYEAVGHDYETWRPKLAPNGIVLFHDVAPSSGYGSARFWQEVSTETPGFAFLHSYGLGVLLPNGSDGRDALIELGSGPWRPYYEHRAGHDLRERQVVDLTALVEARSELVASTEALVRDRDEALRATEALVRDRDEALRATKALVRDRDEALAEQVVELAEAQGRAARLELELVERNAEIHESHSRLHDALATSERLRNEVEALTVDRDALAAGLERYRRALQPVRRLADPFRRLLRRGRRGSVPALPAPQPDAVPPALFDADWYRSRYPDVVRAGVDPWTHWVTYGWREGREPCPLFSAGVYLQRYPDVAAAGVDPLRHWTESGWKEHRDPSSLFSTSFYLDRNGDELGHDTDPLGHYLTEGVDHGLFVSPEHERGVLDTGTRALPIDELLTDTVVWMPDGSSKSMPYEMVVDLDADLFTFDLWDSILTRARPADSAKLATARRMRVALGLGPDAEPGTWELMRRRVAIEAAIAGPDNGEYLLTDVMRRLLDEIGLVDPAEREALAESLRRAELADEIGSTVAVMPTMIVIDKLLARDDATRVLVLSDFYLSGKDLSALLAHHGLAHDRLDVVSSIDVGQSKHGGGGLFRWARERTGVDADRHVHVGDNSHADVAMQTSTGGTAVHLVHGERRYAGPGHLDPASMEDVVGDLVAQLEAEGELRSRSVGLRPRPEDRIVRAAWRTSLLPVALVAAAIEDAAARGLDRVHYLSREGLFLARVHEAVAAILMPAAPPAAVHLAVSRRSTFGPSRTELTTDSLLDLWRMYAHQSPRGLLVSLGAHPDDYAEALARVGLGLDEMIHGVHLDQRVEAFVEDHDVKESLAHLNAGRREALLAYVSAQTDLDLPELLVVDVGWRGTVQDNLARLLPDTHVIGWYLALFPFLNPQPPNGRKSAVGPDGNAGGEFAFMEPPAAVERPWTPAAPSVVDYRLDPEDGVVTVLDEEVLDSAQRDAIARYQDAVVEAAPTVARWIVANGAATDVLRPLVARTLESYYRSPEPGIADLWFDTAHDDTFGVLNVTSFAKDRPAAQWFREGLGPGFLRHVERAASASLWPAGYRRWRPVEAAIAVERALRTGRFDR